MLVNIGIRGVEMFIVLVLGRLLVEAVITNESQSSIFVWLGRSGNSGGRRVVVADFISGVSGVG